MILRKKFGLVQISDASRVWAEDKNSKLVQECDTGNDTLFTDVKTLQK